MDKHAKIGVVTGLASMLVLKKSIVFSAVLGGLAWWLSGGLGAYLKD